MSTMTATRGTPVAPSQTQNTAPVHEYRCLFTREAHKKAKKWHDGSLRFHTFNRRVVVYDDGNHKVGDLHYRQEEDFGEGVELTLDSRVLVQVEQQIGQTETDISQVVHARQDEGQDRVKRIRLAAAATQQSQQSLKALLGSSQRHGRARMPYQSPYEQRHPATEQSEPLAKRRRLSVEKENVPPAISVQMPSAAPPRTLSGSVAHVVAPRRTMAPPPTLPVVHEVMDLSSDEEIINSVSRKPAKPLPKPAVEKVVHSVQPKKAVRSKRPKQKQTPQRSSLGTVGGQRTEPTGASKATSLEKPANVDLPRTSGSNEMRSSAKSGKTLLRIASSKPRRKLMYKALLPQFQSRKPVLGSLGEAATATVDHSRRPVSPVAPKQPSLRSEATSSRRGSVDDPIGVSSSPLFEPAEHVIPPDEEPAPSQDSLEMQLLQDAEEMRESTIPDCEPVGVAIPPQQEDPAPTQDSLEDHTLQDADDSRPLSNVGSAKASSAVVHSAFSPAMKQRTSQRAASVSPAHRLMPPPHIKLEPPSNPGLVTSPSPRTRPFRRVLSENDTDLLDVGEATQQVMNEMLQPRSSRSPTKLTRTTSDTTSIRQPPQIASITSIDVVEPVAETGESGPWTSTEAFLLFEWWPPGKQKPYYGGQPNYGNGFKGGRRDEISALGGITSARDMIRDDVNVL